MKKRWIAVLLCAALLAAFGWGQPRISGEGETYDLYFLEADLSDAPGGDALRAEPLYIESGEVRDTRELAEYLVTELLAGPEDAALTSAIPEAVSYTHLDHLPGGPGPLHRLGHLFPEIHRVLRHPLPGHLRRGPPQRLDAQPGDVRKTVAAAAGMC